MSRLLKSDVKSRFCNFFGQQKGDLLTPVRANCHSVLMGYSAAEAERPIAARPAQRGRGRLHRLSLSCRVNRSRAMAVEAITPRTTKHPDE